MLLRLIKLLNRNKGFTIVEILIAVAITGIISVALGNTTVQLIKYHSNNSNKTTLIRSLDTAGIWFVRDFESVSSIKQNTELQPGNGNEIKITQSIDNLNDTSLAYYLDSNNNLIRKKNDVTNQIIATNIVNVKYMPAMNNQPDKILITAQKGSLSLSREIQVHTRIIKPGLRIITTSPPNASVGTADNEVIKAEGAISCAWNTVNLPSWATLTKNPYDDLTAFITGTPSVTSSMVTFTVKVSSSGDSDERNFSIEVGGKTPVIQTLNAKIISETSALLRGNLSFGGYYCDYVYFQYGVSSVSEYETPPLEMYNSGDFQWQINNLQNGKTYQFRAVVKYYQDYQAKKTNTFKYMYGNTKIIQ